jgi:hypothetical protein
MIISLPKILSGRDHVRRYEPVDLTSINSAQPGDPREKHFINIKMRVIENTCLQDDILLIIQQADRVRLLNREFPGRRFQLRVSHRHDLAFGDPLRRYGAIRLIPGI